MTSIWGDIKSAAHALGGAAEDLGHATEEQAKSIGSALIAPPGAVWDIAHMAFDGKDQSFGDYMHAAASRAGDVLDPIFNPGTLTGGAIDKGLAAMNWALINGVSEPIATTGLAFSHASAAGGSPLERLHTLFSGDTWAEAYNIAQHESAGKAITQGLFQPNTDQFDLGLKTDENGNVLSPFDQGAGAEHPHLAGPTAFLMNAAGAWFLDPVAVGGKALGLARAKSMGSMGYGGLSDAQRADLFKTISDSSAPGRVQQNMVSRTDKWINWTLGQNKLARPLTAKEILAGTPELARMTRDPHVVAGLVADAQRISDKGEASNAIRRILAVASGDTSQIERLRNEMAEGPALADTLKNMVNDSTVDLNKLAAIPTLRTDPVFVASLESQLKNINSSGDIDKFVDGWNARLGVLIGHGDEGDTGIAYSMKNLPGVHPMASKGALDRENGTGVLRTVRDKHRELDNWQAKQSQKMMSAQSLYQRGKYAVPLVTIKTAGLLASPYTKWLPNTVDALRQVHYTGVAHLHDWGGAANQLDSMMRLANVPHGERLKALSEAYLATDEAAKMRAINGIESLSMKSLANEYATKWGRGEIDQKYIEQLMLNGAAGRATSLAHIRGRAYAATEMPPEMADQMALRSGGVQKAEDAAAWGGERQAKWRVDQVDDHGTPISLPLLDTQLANAVPLLDMNVARTMLKRDNGYFARLSRAWKQDAQELDRLGSLRANAKGSAALKLDAMIGARQASMDWLVGAGQKAMHVWKFGVLFRLGYPIRVLMDDHPRIWSQINAATFYGENLKELAPNALWNNRVWGDRGMQARKAMHDLHVRRQEILDELESERIVNHGSRRADMIALDRKIAGYQKRINNLQRKITAGGKGTDAPVLRERLSEAQQRLNEHTEARDFTIDQMGDYGPDDLKRELESVEEQIAAGVKAQRPEKRRIGQKAVKVGDGHTIAGAFEGADGDVFWNMSGSKESFENQLAGVEDRMRRSMSGGFSGTISPDRGAAHLHAWADVLNNQFRNSDVAMHFVNGGDVEDFVRWLKKPAQASLRRRVSHYSHDPVDWANRVRALVYDYIPTDALRQAVASRRLSARELDRLVPEGMRPAVHGQVVADNLGTSAAALSASRGMNRVMKYLGELPTDSLSRHPYFNSMYKMHARDIFAVKKAGKKGAEFTQKDLDEIASAARRQALRDVKRTLFDVSAHSHAAHVLRFVSPFFAAHQEGVARWWRIAADNPQVIRRFTQAFDTPRYLQIEVDKDGNLVKPGSPLSKDHYILMQLPKMFGGKDPHIHQSKWRLSEMSFNLVLQGGLTNPGLGPFTQVPLDWAAQHYAQDPEIERIARVFSPYPPNSPLESAVPATLKRLSALTYGATGHDPSLGLGIGQREYTQSFGRNVQDAVVDFQLKHGREPNQAELDKIMKDAGTHSTVEMFHRVLWNGLSPAPAVPNSKYSLIQQGWYKIQTQAQAEGKDFDWAFERFKAKYGEAYLPLVYSSSNNPGWVDANPATVGAIKKYKGVLANVDPALTRMVVGPYAEEMIQKNATLGDYSPESRNFLAETQMRPGSSDTYYSYDEPRSAAEEQMARRGWAKYGELTGSLTAIAQAKGLNSYEDDPQLVTIKTAGVAQIQAENYAFARDYGQVDSKKYDGYLADMQQIATSSQLAHDPERTDIKTLQQYLSLRDTFSAILQARQAAGLGGPDAQANDGIRKAFTAMVGQLVQSNTYFETYFYNGVIERDPLLVKEAAA